MLSQILPPSTDVFIIGAGPTGLALAITLQMAGVDHLIVDALPSGLNTSRAAVIHAHTLEILSGIGVADDLVAAGLKLGSFSISDGQRTLVRLDFQSLETIYAHLLMLPQDVTESILANRLTALGGTIHRSVTAIDVVHNSTAANVELERNGKRQNIAARYVVGADGMRSLVRRRADIGFKGSQYEHSFVLADIDMTWELGREEVRLFFSKHGLVVVAPLPDGSFRVVATMEDAPETPTASDIQKIIRERGPTDAMANVTHVFWSSRFRLHHRLAEKYRMGRLFLVGDAAHVHSPAGGQGMNTGIVDAVTLGRMLSAVVKDHKPEAHLDAYERLRRPAAEEVLKLADGLTRMATVANPARRTIRNALLGVAGRLPMFRKRKMMNLSGLARREASELPDTGKREARAPGGQKTSALVSSAASGGGQT